MFGCLGGLSRLLFLFRLFLLLLGFLLCLDALKLIKDVLVVQQGVGEFVHEDCPGEEPLDAALKHGYFQELVDGWPLGRVPLEHHLDDVGDSGGVVTPFMQATN